MPRLQERSSRIGAILLAAVLALVFGLIVALVSGFLRVATPPDFGPTQRTVWALVSFSAALGALAMVLVQVTRQLVPFRGEFHRQRLKGLLQAAPDVEKVLGELGGGADSDEVFDMPLEQLCGQLAAAADRVVADPDASSDLATALAGSAGKRTLETLRKTSGEEDNLERLTAQQTLGRIIQGRIDRFQIKTGAAW